jgi:hypothetical protein
MNLPNLYYNILNIIKHIYKTPKTLSSDALSQNLLNKI